MNVYSVAMQHGGFHRLDEAGETVSVQDHGFAAQRGLGTHQKQRPKYRQHSFPLLGN